MRKQAQGLKWYLRGEKKSRAYISRTQCQELIYFPGFSLLMYFLWLSAPLHHAGDLRSLENRPSLSAGCRQHQLMEELEAYLRSLPTLSSKCRTRLAECQAGSANGEHTCDRSRQLHGAGTEWWLTLHSDISYLGLGAIPEVSRDAQGCAEIPKTKLKRALFSK